MISDQARMDDLLDRTRVFVRDVAIPNEDRTEAEDKVPEEVIAAMRGLGTFGWSIPVEYGGQTHAGQGVHDQICRTFCHGTGTNHPHPDRATFFFALLQCSINNDHFRFLPIASSLYLSR